MSQLFEDLKTGLTQAIDHAKGNIKLKTVKIEFDPIPKIKGNQIRKIRNNIKLTQDAFAQMFGVSKKTVESWERGTNIPNGPSQRILNIIKDDPQKIELFGIRISN